MSNSVDQHGGFIKGADFLVDQVLPAQLDLLQSFLPMDYWMVGRQDGKQFEVIVTHGDAGQVPVSCLLDALADDWLTPEAGGALRYRPNPEVYRTESRHGAGSGPYPKYVFKAFLPDRQGRPTGVVAGFLIQTEPTDYQPFHTPVIMLCLNAMAHTLSLHMDLALADKLMLEAQQGARIDSLTGILNRAGWDHVLSDARSAAGEIAIGFLDLDQLKLINDTQGHQAGDQTLKLTAQLVKKSLRAHDCVARLGGDEFAVLLPDASLSDAHELSERLQQALSEKGISASIGVATKSEAGALQKALELADARMYENKLAKRAARHLAGVTLLASHMPKKKE